MASEPVDDFTDEDPIVLLTQARQRAQTLLEKLIAQMAQVEKNPPKISPEALAQGRQAMTNAIAAARRTIEALDGAIATAPGAMKDDSGPPPEDPGRWN